MEDLLLEFSSNISEQPTTYKLVSDEIKENETLFVTLQMAPNEYKTKKQWKKILGEDLQYNLIFIRGGELIKDVNGIKAL